MWNVPNSLTLLRILLAPLLVVVLLTEFPDKEIWGLVIFLVAALTDALDGIIARRTNRITVTGAMLDPIADKLLMSAAFISLVELGLAPAWMVTLIVGREFAVTGLRLIALERNIPISANFWGFNAGQGGGCDADAVPEYSLQRVSGRQGGVRPAG